MWLGVYYRFICFFFFFFQAEDGIRDDLVTGVQTCALPIFDVKVILFGDRELYYLLAGHDPEFSRLFKVQADFDDTIQRSAENDHAYARLIASIVTEHKLNPVDADGVARLIEEGARLADD